MVTVPPRCDGNPPCNVPPQYHIVTGCLREGHIRNYECCLSHMMKIKVAFETGQDPVYCLGCYQNGYRELVLIDDLMIEAYSGQEIHVAVSA